MATERLHVSVPEEMAQFLRDRNISPSALIQDAIRQRMEEIRSQADDDLIL